MSPSNDPNDPNNHHDPLNFDEDDMLVGDNRHGDDEHPDDAPKGVSLAEIWRNNPSLKIFAVVLVIGIFLIVFLVFGGKEEADPSAVGGGSAVNQPPGTAQLPPAYEDAVKSASEQRAVAAETTGGSALPTPIGTAERIEAPPAVENVDPLAEWRRAAEQRASERRSTEQVSLPPVPVEAPPVVQPQTTVVQQQAPQGPPPLPTDPNQQEIDALSQRLSEYMKAIVDNQTPRAGSVVSVGGVPTGFEPPKDTGAQQSAQQAQQAASAAAQAALPKVIIPAGTVGYAQTLIAANTDVPGPVLAELASGPLSGARLLGAFQAQDELMTLQFTRAIYKGKEYNIQAYALDPATTLPALASDVDHHYTQRILIPAAARFIQGFSQGISQRGTTVVVNNSSTVASTDPLNTRESTYQGAAEAANQVASIVQQDANKPITISLDAGTRMGLLFTTSVTDQSGDPAIAGTPAYQQRPDNAQGYNIQPNGANNQPASSTGVPSTNYSATNGTSTYNGYNNTYPNNGYANNGYYQNNPGSTRIITTGTPVR